MPRTIRRIIDRFQRVRLLRQRYGNAYCCYAILRRAALLPGVRRVVHFCGAKLYCLSLAEAASGSRALRHFNTRMATRSDVDELAEYYGDRKKVECRLERGDVCFVAENRLGIGAAVWISFGPQDYQEDAEELGVWIRCEAGAAWSYDGKGTVFGAWGVLAMSLPAFLSQQGVTHLMAQIGGDNWRSRDAHCSQGYREFGCLVCVRLLGIEWVRVGSPNYSLRKLPVQLPMLGITTVSGGWGDVGSIEGLA